MFSSPFLASTDSANLNTVAILNNELVKTGILLVDIWMPTVTALDSLVVMQTY